MRYHLETYGKVQVELFKYIDEEEGEAVFSCHSAFKGLPRVPDIPATEAEAFEVELRRLAEEKAVIESQIEAVQKLKEAR